MARTLRPEQIFPITTRELEVLRVADVTPGMRRVTVGGPGLRAHTASNGQPVAAFRSEGFDDEFKLILPDPETGTSTPPTQADGVLDWPAGSFTDTRTYTVRRFDAEAGEIDIDVVKHGSGRATTWAYRCQPGERIHVAGPKMSYGTPEVEWLLIAGDETALPAIGRWLEELPEGMRASVFIEVGSDEHVQELAAPASATITWLSRKGAPAGTTTLMEDALRQAPWLSDDVFAWVAGETLTLTPIRRWLRNEKGLPRERVEVTGYWRRAVSATADAEAPAEDPFHEIEHLLDLAPGISVRVAVTIGLIAALGDGGASAPDLGARLGVDASALARLLAYLATLNLVSLADGVWQLTAIGQELDDDYFAEHLNLDRADGVAEIGLLGLLTAVRTGREGYTATFGRSFTERIEADPALAASRLTSDLAEWTATPFAQSNVLDGVAELRIAGPGCRQLAEAVLRERPSMRVRILVTPAQAQGLPPTDRLTVEVGSVLDRRPELTDAYVLCGVLPELPEADAVHALAEAAASTHTGTVLVLDDSHGLDLDDDHELVDDLLMLAVHGGQLRSPEQLDALAERAGLRTELRETIGWGQLLRRFSRA